jgi:CheY-like chemotaxis protein
MYPDSEIRIICSLEHIHMVNIHQQKIERVFANILGNAYQAMGRAGQLWIHTKEYNGKVEFCIGNDGPGLPEGEASRLFDPFFTHGKKSGTGLGLAIAKKVVSAHGGDIWCTSSKRSDSKRGKVEFYFTLPVFDAHDMHHCDDLLPHFEGFQKSSNDHVCFATISDYRSDKNAIDFERIGHSSFLTKPEVLVIDDNPFILDAWSESLWPDAETYLISTFERLEHHAAAEPNFLGRFLCVITDFNLEGSGLDGIEIARFIKSQCAQIPIFLSSDGAHSIASTDGAIDQIIGKDPISMANLNDLIGKSVEKNKFSSV